MTFEFVNPSQEQIFDYLKKKLKQLLLWEFQITLIAVHI